MSIMPVQTLSTLHAESRQVILQGYDHSQHLSIKDLKFWALVIMCSEGCFSGSKYLHLVNVGEHLNVDHLGTLAYMEEVWCYQMTMASNVEEKVCAAQLTDLLEAGASFWVSINGDINEEQSWKRAKWSRIK